MRNNIWLVIMVILWSVPIGSPADQFQTAETFLKHREFEKAAEAFLAFAQSEPGHEDAPLALYSAAQTRMLVQDRSEEATALFQHLISRYPESEWAFYGALRMGEHAFERGDTLQAASAYEGAVTIGERVFPPLADANDAQFSALKKCGDIYLDLRQHARAEPYFSELLEAKIDDRRAMPEIYAKLAACLEGQGKGPDAAETYRRLIEMYPTSRQACGLCQTKEKIDAYSAYEWSSYEYFVEGYTVFRTWPARAAEHFINLESTGAAPDLVQTAQRLLPWVYYYSNDFEKAQQAHEAYLKRYPDDTDPYAVYFPMYLDEYHQEYEFKKFLTSISIRTAERDTAIRISPEEECAQISGSEGWKVVDLTPHHGYYNHLLFVNRPLNVTDVAYVRFNIKTGEERTTALEVATDDPWTVWLNGHSIGEFTGNPGRAPLHLVPGWNEVVVKLIQLEGDMVATFRCVNDRNEAETDLICRATNNE